jgi:hypothetical protein
MSNLLSGLAELGLGNLEDVNIFEKPKKKEKEKPVAEIIEHEPEEKDFIFDKTITCPVCNSSFTAKTMKANKCRAVGMDWDLKPIYAELDAVKYEVYLCPECGYAALPQFFPRVTDTQARLIRENIGGKVQLNVKNSDIYTYPEAYSRYKLALASAVVKRSKSSEKAFICLKTAWVIRGYLESLKREPGMESKIEELSMEEDEYLQNAYEGFSEARQTENFPMCGMDQLTVDYLLAALATRFERYDIASRLIATILTSRTASERVKEKARVLKDEMLAKLRK